MKIKYNNLNPDNLYDELVNAGIMPIWVESDTKKDEFIAQNIWVTFADDVDMTAVQAVIDVHNPEPVPPLPTKEEIIEQELANTNSLILEVTEMILGGM